MQPSDLAQNLRLLCSYAPSVSAVCRDLRINRQQFHRYLSGETEPSLRKLRAICDYFGLEESEILLDQSELKKIIVVKGIHPSLPDPFGNFIAKLHQINPSSTKDLSRFVGYYYTYIKTVELGGRILRALIRLEARHDYVYVKSIENYSAVRRRKRKILKYSGIAYHTGDGIYIHEREVFAGKMIWTTILDPVDDDQFDIMTGLTLGITSSNRRSIAAYRVLWERLHFDGDLRRMLRGCGVYEANSPQISRAIRDAIDNDIGKRDRALLSRPWVVEDD